MVLPVFSLISYISARTPIATYQRDKPESTSINTYIQVVPSPPLQVFVDATSLREMKRGPRLMDVQLAHEASDQGGILHSAGTHLYYSHDYHRNQHPFIPYNLSMKRLV